MTQECPSCNKLLDGNTTSCPYCEYKFESTKNYYKCSVCNKKYSESINFCPEDGGKILQASATDTYPKASLRKRFLAALIDSFVTVPLLVVAKAIDISIDPIINSSSNIGADVYLVLFISAILYLGSFIYSLIKDGLNQGQSIGKRSMGLMVVKLENNRPCSIGQSCIRTLVSIFISIIPVVGIFIEGIMILANEDGRRLSDMAAGTQVIEVKDYNQQ